MQFNCPFCKKSYQLPDQAIPAEGARLNCASCGSDFSVLRGGITMLHTSGTTTAEETASGTAPQQSGPSTSSPSPNIGSSGSAPKASFSGAPPSGAVAPGGGIASPFYSMAPQPGVWKGGNSGLSGHVSPGSPSGHFPYIGAGPSALAPAHPWQMPVLQAGEVLLDEYEIKKELGSGKFAHVYLAYNRSAAEDFALKVIPSYGQSASLLPLLRSEYQAQRRIESKRHVLLSEAPRKLDYQGLEWVLLPMEVADKSLRQWLSETSGDLKGRLEEGLDLFRQACRGMAAIHEAGIIHRDVKPGNLLLVREPGSVSGGVNWTVKVADFGLSLGLRNLAESHPRLLADGIGTAAYMSPEQILSARPKDIKESADIYGLGMILYELLDGDLPYFGNAESIREKKRDPHVRISPPEGDWPSNLINAAMLCLDRDPAKRPVSALELERLVSRDPDEDATFAQAEKSNTENGWQAFLKKWPSGWRRDEANAKLASLVKARKEAWEHKRETFIKQIESALPNHEKANKLLGNFAAHLGDKYGEDPDYVRLHGRMEESRDAAEDKDFAAAQKANSEKSWESFLLKWPESRKCSQARASMKKIQEERGKVEAERKAREKAERKQREREEQERKAREEAEAKRKYREAEEVYRYRLKDEQARADKADRELREREEREGSERQEHLWREMLNRNLRKTEERRRREAQERRLHGEEPRRSEDGRFTRDSVGVITDRQTGLQWYVRPDKDSDWEEAKRWVNGLSVSGGGWRMPNLSELRGIRKKGARVDQPQYLPPIFPTSVWFVWSGETKDPTWAWGFDFTMGKDQCANSYMIIGRGGSLAFAVRPQR